jgi:hypothetical protein
MTERDKAYLLKQLGDEDEMYCFGFLYEERTEGGELTLMYLEPFAGEQEELVGDNLLYFAKLGPQRFGWADFESYPGLEEVELDDEDRLPSYERADLQRALEDAEETIRRVRAGEPLQRILLVPGDRHEDSFYSEDRIVYENLVRRKRLGPRRQLSCQYDLIVSTKRFRNILRRFDFDVQPAPEIVLTMDAETLTIKIGLGRRARRYKIPALGKWRAPIAVSGVRLAAMLERHNESNLRITYIAGRLFVSKYSVSARMWLANSTAERV